MSELTLAKSLSLLIGRELFDGAAPEVLAKKHRVSVDVIHQARLDCREQSSRYFAEKERFEFRLLNDHEIQTRMIESLRLLLDWYDAAVLAERFEDSQQPQDDSEPDNNPKNLER